MLHLLKEWIHCTEVSERISSWELELVKCSKAAKNLRHRLSWQASREQTRNCMYCRARDHSRRCTTGTSVSTWNFEEYRVPRSSAGCSIRDLSEPLPKEKRVCSVGNVFSGSVATRLGWCVELCMRLEAMIFRILFVKNCEYRLKLLWVIEENLGDILWDILHLQASVVETTTTAVGFYLTGLSIRSSVSVRSSRPRVSQWKEPFRIAGVKNFYRPYPSCRPTQPTVLKSKQYTRTWDKILCLLAFYTWQNVPADVCTKLDNSEPNVQAAGSEINGRKPSLD